MSLGKMLTSIQLIALLLLNLSSIQLSATSQRLRQQDSYKRHGERTLAEVQLPKNCGLWYQNKQPVAASRLRVSNGTPAQEGQFPSFVKVHFYNRSQGKKLEWWCGGVIVTQWHILTAAHCIKSHLYSLSNSYVFDPAANRLRYRSEKYCVLDDFYEKANWSRVTPYVKNDIALLRLDKPIEFNDLVQPVCLPSVPLKDTPKGEVMVVGLGFVEDTESEGEARPPSGTRRRNERCYHSLEAKLNRAQILPKIPQLSSMQQVDCKPKDTDESTICFWPVNGGGGSICRGDSGGPVYGVDERNRQVLYALPSYVDFPCSANQTHKSVMANVWALREPIKKLIERC